MKKLSMIAQKKIDIGYLQYGPTCRNCIKFTSEIINSGGYVQEKTKRCSDGGFAVGKMSWCENHEFNKILK